MSLQQKALTALENADYSEVFILLEQAKVMNTVLHDLKNEFIAPNLQARFAQRLKLAIEDAFTHSPTHSFTSSTVWLTHSFAHALIHFVGRKEELQTLHKNLQAGKHTVLVNGVGGIGKTALAQKYAHDYQTDYAHILWIRQNSDLMNSFVQIDLFCNLYLTYDVRTDKQILFTEALEKLHTLQGINLLIIDNYEPTDTDKTHDTLNRLFALPAQWRVVCTSRVDVPRFDKTLLLGVLPAEEAIEVFKQHVVGKPVQDAEIDALLKMVGYHTLMTELLAKTYRETMHFDSVGKLHAFLQAEALHHPHIQEDIYVSGQETQLYTHLRTVFSLANLSEDELWLLKQWVVLPTAPHKGTDFLAWIQDKELAYAKTLKALAKKGWLQTEDYLAYALHPFLQLFLHQELKPTLPDCEKMRRYFSDLMDLENVKANPLAYQWTIAIGEAMIQHIDFTDHKEKQGLLWNRICNVYMFLGDYPNAIICAKENIAIKKATVGEQHEDYATALNNLAFLYRNQGDYAEALPLYQEALPIWKEVLGEQHPNYATALNNLAVLYRKQGNYAEALPLYQESLQIRKEVLGKQHPDYASSLNNLANLHNKQGNYVEALPLYQEALQIRKEVLGERHPDYALSLHNIGVFYVEQKDYKQARQCLEEAYSIRVEKLGEQHPYTQDTKEWLDKLPDTES